MNLLDGVLGAEDFEVEGAVVDEVGVVAVVEGTRVVEGVAVSLPVVAMTTGVMSVCPLPA